jgi:hypothetical protein
MRSGFLPKTGGQFLNLCVNLAALSHQFSDLRIGMEHRGVISSAEDLPDL